MARIPPAPSPPPSGDDDAADSGPSDVGVSESLSNLNGGGSAVSSEDVQTTDQVSCEEEVVIVEENLTNKEIIEMMNIPEGYVIAARPFKAQCAGGESFKMSVVVPDNIGDVKALRCVGDACTTKTTTVTTKICPDKDVETFREEDVYTATASALNLTSVSGNISEGNRSLTSGNVSVEFGGDGEASLEIVTEVQPQPMNKNVRIVGTPIVISSTYAKERQGRVNVTIPYFVQSDDDEHSIAVYAKQVDSNGTNWLYIGGSIDTINKIVRAEVNLSAYAQDGKVTLAPITILCQECGSADFVNRFTPVPDTRQAIILLHGLWGVGKVWEGLIREFKTTNQPYQLWTFDYLANQPIEESAADLANYLEANKHRFDRLYIIGYSLGGLVTQASLDYAYNERLTNSSRYGYLNKLNKVLLVGVPNKGSPVAGYLTTFLSEYINSEATDVIPLNNAVKDLLEEGISINPIPNVSYYAIAGTKTYDFMKRIGLERKLFKGELNDGLVAVSSVQTMGNTSLDEFCVNFWSQPVIHTLLIDDRLVQKIMGQIISSDVYSELADDDIQTNLFGFSSYFELEIDDCSPDDLYVVIGKEKSLEEIERAAYCACGNGVCDGIEDIGTCPEDCAILEKPLVQRIIERSLSMLALILVLFMVGGFIFVIWEHKKLEKERLAKERKLHIHIPKGFNINEVPDVGDVKYKKAELMDLRSTLKQLHEHRWFIGEAESKAELSKEAKSIQDRIDKLQETLMREGLAQSIKQDSKSLTSIKAKVKRKSIDMKKQVTKKIRSKRHITKAVAKKALTKHRIRKSASKK